MNVNTVTIIGNLTKDPVHRTYQDGKPLTTFTVATNRGKGKEGKVEFHNVVTFGRLAEICKEFLRKGRLVYVQGRMQTSRWEDENKVLHSKTDIIAREMLLLDKKQALVRAASEDDDATEAVINLKQVPTPA